MFTVFPLPHRSPNSERSQPQFVHCWLQLPTAPRTSSVAMRPTRSTHLRMLLLLLHAVVAMQNSLPCRAIIVIRWLSILRLITLASRKSLHTAQRPVIIHKPICTLPSSREDRSKHCSSFPIHRLSNHVKLEFCTQKNVSLKFHGPGWHECTPVKRHTDHLGNRRGQYFATIANAVIRHSRG